ncbi:Rapid ALkalinization Factor [Heracleum sosnowskyi]|uniref:Rapid ALkalinization Factor n=1 Tax=Heracleum sosnowskyi TaxID=360622 RepID=A0AAD8ICK4_9APIA|nr:Rapid ALkalinization Factor [Heracleum sosnowskyi]
MALANISTTTLLLLIFFFSLTTISHSNAQILLHSDNALNSDLASTVSLYDDNEFSEEDEDIDLGEDAGAYDDGSVSGGRSLLWERVYRRRSRYYISYGVLMANKIPCPPRSGRSYYTHNCYKHKHPANPYTRGCSAITRCRR